jgi:uncharacterized iron-regulated membrane protein
MRALILLHRWLGVAFCLLFAMWFGTGIVMHFVPFPALTEAERVGGLAPIDISRVMHGPADAVMAGTLRGVSRVRLLERSDGSVYLLSGTSGVSALHSTDLSDAAVRSEQLAMAIATDHAHRRGLNASHAKFVELALHDQWTVPNGLDLHRPLYRIALNDEPGTELYVSSTTGEILRDTTRRERLWNYAGSVTHWIYPTALRRNWTAWDRLVWWLSLAAMVGAVSGAVLGLLRLKIERRRVRSPYRGWHGWHHWLGLLCMTFVLTWIFSGWLSMDHGRLFSTGQFYQAEPATLDRLAALNMLTEAELNRTSARAKEIEWFVFGAQIYRRERLGFDTQRLFVIGPDASSSLLEREFLSQEEASDAANRLAVGCKPAIAVGVLDDYPVAASMPSSPVYRSICGVTWLHFDGANGAILETMDTSRRTYRWAYEALHTLDFPSLTSRPSLRTAIIIALCGGGLAFSLSAVVIAWRRVRYHAGLLRPN